MNSFCVYIHRNKINNKVYIGMTSDTQRRWRCNGIEYKPSKTENQNRPFWNAIQKYGWDNFEHSILISSLTFEEAIHKERELIKSFNSTDKYMGYNVSAGGNGGRVYKEHPRGMKGKVHSEEKKRQQSALMKKLNDEGKVGNNWKNGHPKGMLGKTHSEEYKEWLRTNNVKGNHPSAKRVKATFPDSKVIIFKCAKDAQEYFGIGSVFYRIVKSGKPYQIPKACTCKDKLTKIENVKLEYIIT